MHMPPEPKPKKPRYKFVVGSADKNHTDNLNEAAKEKYRAILITTRPAEGHVVVLMENED